MSSEPAAPVYRFILRRASADQSGYSIIRWNDALPMAILAATSKEAITKAEAVSGDPSPGCQWTFRTDAIEEVGT